MKIGSRRGALLVGLILVGTSPGRAQVPGIRFPIDSGTLIRVHLVGDSAVRGRLLAPLAASASVIQLCRFPGPPCSAMDDPGVKSWPVTAVRHLDVARGSGARSGGIIGALIGFLMGTSLGQFCIDGPCPTASHAALHTGLPFAAAFALIGAGFGSGSVHWGAPK